MSGHRENEGWRGEVRRVAGDGEGVGKGDEWP